MYIDDAFREWWVEHLGRPPIPKDCNIIKVHNAIQGHPEAPRLWEKHINKILRAIGLRPTMHEPCLYSGQYQGQRINFLRQVGDFSVAAKTKSLAKQLIAEINTHMQINLKTLDVIKRFNGIDIHQTRHYFKVTCEKYLYKMLKHHNWLQLEHPTPASPPIPSDAASIIALEQAELPTTEDQKANLLIKMGWNYRQVIGELIAVKCRPDILYHVTKLSQYMDNPAEVHHLALFSICQYLSKTIYDGIYYWRPVPCDDLPDMPPRQLHPHRKPCRSS